MIKKDGPILLLTWASGCLDALSYVGLGQVFVANMTGNTVLFGLAIAQGDQLTILRSLTALLGFALGAMCSAFLVERNYERPRGTWTPRVVLATDDRYRAAALYPYAGATHRCKRYRLANRAACTAAKIFMR
jgi:ethanolamine transporter EutH